VIQPRTRHTGVQSPVLMGFVSYPRHLCLRGGSDELAVWGLGEVRGRRGVAAVAVVAFQASGAGAATFSQSFSSPGDYSAQAPPYATVVHITVQGASGAAGSSSFLGTNPGVYRFTVRVRDHSHHTMTATRRLELTVRQSR
jgi:hypothetical protein